MAATGWVAFVDGQPYPFKSGDVEADETDVRGFARNLGAGVIVRPLGGVGAYDGVSSDPVAIEVPEDATSDVHPYR